MSYAIITERCVPWSQSMSPRRLDTSAILAPKIRRVYRARHAERRKLHTYACTAQARGLWHASWLLTDSFSLSLPASLCLPVCCVLCLLVTRRARSKPGAQICMARDLGGMADHALRPPVCLPHHLSPSPPPSTPFASFLFFCPSLFSPLLLASPSLPTLFPFANRSRSPPHRRSGGSCSCSPSLPPASPPSLLAPMFLFDLLDPIVNPEDDAVLASKTTYNSTCSNAERLWARPGANCQRCSYLEYLRARPHRECGTVTPRIW